MERLIETGVIYIAMLTILCRVFWFIGYVYGCSVGAKEGFRQGVEVGKESNRGGK